MVRHLPHPGARGEDMREVPFPLRRVRPLPKASDGGCIQDRLDSAADAARRFRLCRPDRGEHLYDEPGIDRGHRQFPQNGVRASRQRAAPLLPVLRVAPAGLVPRDEFLSNLAKSPALRRRQPLRLPQGRLRIEGVHTLVLLPPVRCGLLSRLGERNVGEGSEPHIAALAVELKSKGPTISCRWWKPADRAHRRHASLPVRSLSSPRSPRASPCAPFVSASCRRRPYPLSYGR
jgi:hypothetical protein